MSKLKNHSRDINEGIFLNGYEPLENHWDEMVLEDGSIRSSWEKNYDFFKTMTPETLREKWDFGFRLIRENGITFNINSNHTDLHRPWGLDPLPLILDFKTWQKLSESLKQRAKLFNFLLKDFYGPQDLIRKGLVPPSIILGHPHFLRPLKYNDRPETPLHFYAVDIARGPDGQWKVLADRCEMPVGAGYALENRGIVSRLFSDALKNQPIQPLAPFFQTMNLGLSHLSPRMTETPRIALLTPGMYNESYFEQAYLARSLGWTLVESQDLTMREQKVWLKTLEGLQPIDILVRRSRGIFCDPLELKSDSLLGVAGLCQAVRANTLTVVNDLGTGLLEGSLMMPFLPELARSILGEELQIESIPSFWCGHKDICQEVVNSIEEYRIKPIFSYGDSFSSLKNDSFANLTDTEKKKAILKRPQQFIAQGSINPSTSPAWNGTKVVASPVILRVFMIAHDGDYLVMPGALARKAPDFNQSSPSLYDGNDSKDVWILADQKTHLFAPPRLKPKTIPLLRGSHDLPSRVAENLFWFGRHLERNEIMTRIIRSGLSRVTIGTHVNGQEELAVILNLLSKLFRINALNLNFEEQILAYLKIAFDPSQTNSPHYSIDQAYRLAAVSRDRLSSDTWTAVIGLHQAAKFIFQSKKITIDSAISGLNNLILASESLSGLFMENMTRGAAWRFVDIGRRLERAQQTVDLMANLANYDTEFDHHILDVGLEIFDSSMTYRSRYLSLPQLAPVFDLLIIDDTNPRSLGFQIAALLSHLDQLAKERRLDILGPDQRLITWLSGAIKTAEVHRLCSNDPDTRRHNLSHFLESIRSRLWELGETLTHQFFTHAQSHHTDSLILFSKDF
jgi:uncharacterized circularly permuted ATP-grasp superfamily protein/uncharacterized alpha-E superfamily protein